MKLRTLTTATLLALAACSTLAHADDPPARVGRVALAEGQVSIGTPGEAAGSALVNWPVTSNNTITTAPGARTELRIGASAIRLDGDSALDVVQLDDQSLRLRLHYGSASIRVANAELAAGFELSTPQARVLLQGAGRIRVDAERTRDTSSVDVFEGVATVEGGGERLTVRAGRSAEMQGNDLRTTQAIPNAFDDWAAARDRQSDRVIATRYVPAEMTGYEDLDRYGSWRTDSEYGTLWMPTVASDWVPYRDGRWTWIAPWGWTWVDNAPWGYAPFHYGRWVHVNRRWAWAPGRLERNPVWAPALVGWVGGAGWNLNVNARPTIGQGWYPLSPHDRFVPGYRLSGEHLRRLNDRHGGRHDGKRDGHDYRQRGLTVVPHDRFGQRSEIVVPREPRLTPPPGWQNAPNALPPAPRAWREREERRADRHAGQDDRGWLRREGDGRDGRDGRADGWDDSRRDARRDNGRDGGERLRTPPLPAPVMGVQAPPQPGAVRQPGRITTLPPPGFERDGERQGGSDGWERGRREAVEDGRRQRGFAPAQEGAGVAVMGAPRPAAPAPAPSPVFVPQRGGVGGAMEAAMARVQVQAQAPQAPAQVQMPRPQATAVAPPPPRAQPSPPPAAAPAQPQPQVERGPRGREGLRHLDR